MPAEATSPAEVEPTVSSPGKSASDYTCGEFMDLDEDGRYAVAQEYLTERGLGTSEEDSLVAQMAIGIACQYADDAMMLKDLALEF